MSSTNEKVEFVFAMAKHSALSLHNLKRIMRYAATHQRLATEDCNRGLTAIEELKVKNVRAAILNIGLSDGVDARFSGDPRGCTVKLVVADGYTNDWGKEGICVPTS
jgi:hypothetical protein